MNKRKKFVTLITKVKIVDFDNTWITRQKFFIKNFQKSHSKTPPIDTQITIFLQF